MYFWVKISSCENRHYLITAEKAKTWLCSQNHKPAWPNQASVYNLTTALRNCEKFKMLSDRYFNIFNLQQKIAQCLIATPFKYSHKQRRVIVTSKNYTLFCMPLLMLLLCTIFQFIQLVRYYKIEHTTKFYYYYLFGMFICCVLVLIAAYPYIRYSEQNAKIITELWRFLSELQG